MNVPNDYKLSNREAEVLRLVVLSKSNQEIANELFLAVGTVKTHIHNILVKNRATKPHDAHPPLLKAPTCQKETGLFWQVLSGQTPTAAGELSPFAAVFGS